MYKNAFVFFALLFFAFSAHAAEWMVNGTVLEKGTRKPLQGVKVTLKEYPELSAVSDAQGRFHLALPAPGNYILRAANGGEAGAVFIQIAEGQPIPSPMLYVPTPQMLREVVVSAERSPDQISKNSMTGKEVRQIAGSTGDPMAALQAMPGVATVSGTSQPAVRGSGPGDNLYYVDGLLVGRLFHFDSISVLNADLVEGFDLYAGAFSPHYGDITGAVIDVALRDPRTDRFGGKVDINMMGANFLVEGPTAANQSFYFAARRSYADLFIKSVARNGVTYQMPDYADYQGKYKWQVNDSNRLTFHILGGSDKLKMNISSTADAAQQQPVLAGDAALSNTNASQGLVLDTAVSGTTVNTLSFGHLTDHTTAKLGLVGTSNVQSDNFMLREKLTMDISGGQELSLGGDATKTSATINVDALNTTCTQFNPNCNLNTAPRAQLTETLNASGGSLSAQDRIRVASSLTLVGGARQTYDDYTNRTYTEPRVGVEWEWTQATMFTAGWGKHHQAPAPVEWVRVFGNPKLDYIRAEDSVLGVRHKVDADWNWKAETYYKKLTNLAVNDPLLNYINGASGKAYGLELLIKKEQTSDLSGWLVVNLARSARRNDVTGEAFRYAFDQPVNTTLVGNYKLSDDWTCGMKWAYHSGTPYTPIVGTAGTYPNGATIPVYAPVNSGTLPVYHRLDIRFDRHYVFDTWKLNTYFELNNVYQRQNIVGYTYNGNYTTRTPITAFTLPISFGVQGEF